MNIKVVNGKNLGTTKAFLQSIQNGVPSDSVLRNVANNTIQKLKQTSPTEEIANGWNYEIERYKNHVALYFSNDCITNNGENLVVLIDNGHVSKDGRWIAGTHFTKECFDEAYKEIFEKTREELNKL